VTEDFIRDTILMRLCEVAPETAERSLDPNTDVCQQLALDDSDYWAYVSAVGDELGLSIPEDDFAKLRTISSGVSYLSTRLPG